MMWISGCTSYHSPTLYFQSSYSFRALASFFPPFFLWKKVNVPSMPLLGFRRHEETCLKEEYWHFWECLFRTRSNLMTKADKIKPDDTSRQIYPKHLVWCVCIQSQSHLPSDLSSSSYILRIYLSVNTHTHTPTLGKVKKSSQRKKTFFCHLFCKCDTGNVSF